MKSSMWFALLPPNGCVCVSSVPALILERQICGCADGGEWSSEATAADAPAVLYIYFFIFFPADEADGVTVRSVAIALGEFPAAVAAAESNRKAASRGRGTTSDSSYSDYRGKKKQI